MIDLSLDLLRDTGLRRLMAHGLTHDNATLILDHLIEAEQSGKTSHGLLRLNDILDRLAAGKNTSNGPPERCIDYPALALIDGQETIGLIAAHHACLAAAEKAKQAGCAMAGAFNFGGTTGAIGIFARHLAQNHGLVSLITCNSYPMVSAPNGMEPLCGTNPIAIGIPSAGHPFLADLAISEWAYGKIRARELAGDTTIPLGVALSKDGAPTTKSRDANDGVMLPMAGHKGFALGVAFELLAGPLVRAHAGTSVTGSDGFCVIAIDPSKLTDMPQFKTQVETYLNQIRGSKRLNPDLEIVAPGDQSQKLYNQNKDKKTIALIDAVWHKLNTREVQA